MIKDYTVEGPHKVPINVKRVERAGIPSILYQIEAFYRAEFGTIQNIGGQVSIERSWEELFPEEADTWAKSEIDCKVAKVIEILQSAGEITPL